MCLLPCFTHDSSFIEFLGLDKTKVIVGEYGKNAMILLLIKVINRFLNPIVDNNIVENVNLFTNSLFDAPTFALEGSEVLYIFMMLVFHNIFVYGKKATNLLT
jgi:hypothetical protein